MFPLDSSVQALALIQNRSFDCSYKAMLLKDACVSAFLPFKAPQKKYIALLEVLHHLEPVWFLEDLKAAQVDLKYPPASSQKTGSLNPSLV